MSCVLASPRVCSFVLVQPNSNPIKLSIGYHHIRFLHQNRANHHDTSPVNRRMDRSCNLVRLMWFGADLSPALSSIRTIANPRQPDRSHSRTSLILPARAGPSAGGAPPPRPSRLPSRRPRRRCAAMLLSQPCCAAAVGEGSSRGQRTRARLPPSCGRGQSGPCAAQRPASRRRRGLPRPD